MKTQETTMGFSPSETDGLVAMFGMDAEYYEQDGQTFVIEFTPINPGSIMSEAFPIERTESGKLKSTGTPTSEFDWESAEAFRGEPFPS